ncbi:MAG: hypothetical protein HZA16_03395 [Nitrospirae bacterium]|nr:hypothetical protein [Nitrospirota bacterium]
MKHIAIIIILTATLTAIPVSASADWKRFIPRPVENRGDLELFTSVEKESGKGGANDLELTDTILRERLTLISEGFVYHPRFIMYTLSISSGLRHESISTSSRADDGWKNIGTIMYSGTMILLPEHPYNLELFARRSEPLLKQGRSRSESTTEGALFRYRKRPVFFSSSYTENTLESTGSTSEVTNFIVSGTYYEQDSVGNLFSTDMMYNHSDFNSSLSLDGDSDVYSLGTLVKTHNASTGLRLSQNTFSQKSPSASLESEQFSWSERVDVSLPLNFDVGSSYSYLENTFTSGAPGAVGTTFLSTTNTFEAGLLHRLYRSLNNSYSYKRIMTESSGSDSDGATHSIATNYTKLIPSGKLTAGVSLSRTVMDTSGATDIVNEPHPVELPVPGAFLLNSQGADQATIRVFLRSPLPPSELIPLVEGINFRVAPFGNTFQITDIIIADVLPAGSATDGTFEFLVTYSLISEKLRLRTDSAGYNLGSNLMNNMVNPYYRFVRMKSSVLSGTFPGEPIDSKSHTVGVVVEKEPVTVLTEYQKVSSNVSPYWAWRNEVEYVHSFSETATGNAAASYVITTYPEGTSEVNGQGYSVKTSTLSAAVQKRIPEKSLLLSAGAAYADTRGLVEASIYSLNSNLVWRVGKLIVSLGASASSSQSKSTAASQAGETKKIHQYYYLNVKRQLF